MIWNEVLIQDYQDKELSPDLVNKEHLGIALFHMSQYFYGLQQTRLTSSVLNATIKKTQKLCSNIF